MLYNNNKGNKNKFFFLCLKNYLYICKSNLQCEKLLIEPFLRIET